MHRSNKNSFFHVPLFLADIVSILLAYGISYKFIGHPGDLLEKGEYLWLLLVFVPLYTSTMNVFGMYDRLTFNYYDRIFRHVFYSVLFTGGVLTIISWLEPHLSFNESFFDSFLILALLIIVVMRSYIAYARRQRGLRKRVLIVGVQSVIDKFQYYLGKTSVNHTIVGYACIHQDEALTSTPMLGDVSELESILKEHIVDEVYFAVGDKHVSSIESYVALCEKMGVTARLVLDLFRLSIAKSHFAGIGTLPMLTLHTVSLNYFQLISKRLLDIAGAIVGIVLTFVLSLVIYPLIKLDSRGPAVFAQQRVGVNGRIFKIYKFRTMYIDAEKRKEELMRQNKIEGGFMFKMDDDPRITKVGRFLRKTSLDELPQFINILKGEMSLVGTRPPTIDEVSRYENHHYRRISIKPGLTGMWQVGGRSEITDFDQVVKLDTEYIDQWSIWLDLKIIAKTCLVVFVRRGAY
ncbi:sugar transferase [Cohnella sp. AR92]|uniref:sugar transferase n=1 Tax=Cohnella sp. AR92 TaxID=648716 RepID=UPI000F8E65DD|nr:sugar transferase [Cohnella sp. AR92]RUS42608.1 sugar transferase [Cohnella sp. AR92]